MANSCPNPFRSQVSGSQDIQQQLEAERSSAAQLAAQLQEAQQQVLSSICNQFAEPESTQHPAACLANGCAPHCKLRTSPTSASMIRQMHQAKLHALDSD